MTPWQLEEFRMLPPSAWQGGESHGQIPSPRNDDDDDDDGGDDDDFS